MTEPPVDDETDTNREDNHQPGRKHADTTSQSTGRTITIGDRQVDQATLVGAFGALWLVLIGWWIDGVVGVGVSLAIAGVAVVAQPVIVLAVAHAGLLLLIPELATVTSLIEISLFELGVLAVVLSERPVEIPAALLTIAFGGVFIASTITVLIWADQLAASVLIVVLGALLAYGIHRYEQVSLGLVDDEPGTTDHGASQ